MDMTNQQFTQQLQFVLRALETLGQYPQWQNLCNGALEARQLTLADATQAIEWAVYCEAEPAYIPTFEEIFGC